MKFEETLSPTLYNVHYYIPTKKETLIQKNMKKKKKVNEEFAFSSFAATGKGDVLGVEQRLPGEKKIVRRKFPKPITLKKKRRKKK